jgi:hypothetical protein
MALHAQVLRDQTGLVRPLAPSSIDIELLQRNQIRVELLDDFGNPLRENSSV